jgi:nitrite reductase/ring-hydroxylating ferredoxin subunit
MAEFVVVGKSEDVPEGTAKAYPVAGKEVAIARSEGVLYGFSDICTHKACNLSLGGEIEGNTIQCECHGSIFDMSDGSVIEGPAQEPIETFPVREQDGELSVEA